MNLRTALLAGMLALAATALRAEEFQMSIQGVGCPNGAPPDCSTTVPVTITADFNSLAGGVSATFAGGIADTLNGNAPLTNYTEIVGSHTLAFAANSSLSFGCFGPVLPNLYECGGSFGGVSGGDIELWMKTVTQAQFQAFSDPLASLLLTNPGFQCTAGGVSAQCTMDGGPFGTLAVQAPVTFTPVPAPGPLTLFLAALIGLALSRHTKHFGSLQSRW